MFEKLLSRGERRFGRYFGIPKLMMILCIGMGVTYVADYLLAAYHISLSYYLMFDREAIFHGQIWRLVSFIFMPPSSSPVFLLISLMFYWYLGTSLQNTWGTFRFSKGDSDLSLRFDLTVPLAKYVALHYADLAFPFRRYQIGKVYRGERAQRGRFREFYQADIDIIGDGKLSITNEAEIPSIIYKTFSTLGLRRFQIRVNNRKILNGFYAMLGLSEQSGDIMRTVDKLDKIGSDKVRVLLVEECGVEETKADEILTFIAIRGTNGEVLSALEQYRGRNEVFDQGLDELSSVTKLLGAFGVPEENFAVDLTIARGLDYYTGTVYETTLLDHPEIGSVCSGGRYDNLAEYYTDRPLPGVGISIGLTRLFYVLNEQRMLNEERVMAPADVMIVPMTDDLEAAVRLATELRAQNIRVQLYAEQKKFKAKIQYADKLHIPYVVFLGEDEIAAGTVSLKDLRTGDQVTVLAQDASARILADMELRGQGTILK